MKIIKRSLAVTLGTLPLLVSLCAIIPPTNRAHAHNLPPTAVKTKGTDSSIAEKKISPDLKERLNQLSARDVERLPVILQLQDKASGQLNALLNRNGVHVRRYMKSLGVYSLELPASVLEELASFEEVFNVSLDQETIPFGHVSTTTGTDLVRKQKTTSLLGLVTATTTLDGRGIGIAVLDSGIDTTHKSFLNNSNALRVTVSRDFTGENRTDDPYGHGTHVASTAAGNGRISNGEYIGIAPNADIINLRVLNSQGAGSTSALLAALDWIMQNRALYRIRIVNMSLGAPAVDTYKNDPICRAVRRLVDAGVVVIAAAGNNGKNSEGTKLYGQIHSPGNEPSALTVGASNTFGTDGRSDDVIASYSSRGPTRSYYTDDGGIKHYDNLIKPDVVAPGNKLIYAQSTSNLLVAQNPQLDAGVSPVDNRKMMYLNGTSMSTPVAAGAAALLLQVNPNLTPNMIKAILMYTAQPLAGYNMLEQGAGQINLEGAVRLAKLVRSDLIFNTGLMVSLGDPLLTASAPAPQTTIAGQTFTWSQGVIFSHTYGTGDELITRYQKVYATGILLGDG
ncbi:MAG: S8 family peptidase, partial [Acidobacteria bacterium]|nr:S8 family peptidase [Acidobacteriota bacterium]